MPSYLSKCLSWLDLGFLWLGQVYALGGGWGGGRTPDQTSPCAVGRESDPSNVLEVYCDTPAGTRKKGEQIFLLESKFNHFHTEYFIELPSVYHCKRMVAVN